MIRKVSILNLLIVWLFFSSLVISQLLNIFPGNFSLLTLKDVTLIFFIGVLTVLSLHRNIYPFLALIPLVLWLIISFFFSDAVLFARIASLRQLAIPFLLMFVGYISVRNEADYQRLEKLVVGVLRIILIIGFIEIVFSLWKYIDIREYYSLKGIFVDKEGYPFIFIEPIRGGIYRMASVLLDPINLGHSLVLLFGLSYRKYGWKNFWTMAALVGIFLTLSKGSILQLILIIFLFNSVQNTYSKLIMFMATLVALVIGYHYHPGLEKHLSGFVNSITSLSFFGHGLGEVGNQAHMYNTTQDIYAIGDSYVGAVIGQIGLFGALLWILPFTYFMGFLSGNSILKRILIAQIIVSSLSENAFNLLSILGLSILVGAMVSVKAELK